MEVLSARMHVAVSDLAASRHFYESVLGLRIAREFGAGGAVTGVVYFCGGGFLELGSLRDAQAGTADELARTFLWLQVGDVAAEHRRLVAAGVVFDAPPRQMPWGLVECWLRDPDGLRIVLVEVPDDHPLRRRVD